MTGDYMTIMEIIMQLDLLAQQANKTWHQCESLKMRIAESHGIPDKKLEAKGIYVPETKKPPEGG